MARAGEVLSLHVHNIPQVKLFPGCAPGAGHNCLSRLRTIEESCPSDFSTAVIPLVISHITDTCTCMHHIAGCIHLHLI